MILKLYLKDGTDKEVEIYQDYNLRPPKDYLKYNDVRGWSICL